MTTIKKPQRTILCTWEMGSELGHISRLGAIVKALEAQNYRVFVALKDLSRAHDFFKDSQAVLLQAPTWLPNIKMQRPIASLADSMSLLGYLEADALHCLVTAWRSLINLVKPDLVIFDYSPTAMLALHQEPVAKVLVGSGFADPVPGSPIVDWRPYAAQDQVVQRQESRVLGVINQVLQRDGIARLTCLADLFAVDHSFITIFRDFDLYSKIRKGATYCIGAGFNFVRSAPSSEVGVDSVPRIVAYLKPSYPHFTLLVQALAECNAPVFIVCPRGNPEVLQPFASNTLAFSTDVIDLPKAISTADLFVGHGNSGSVKESLILGKPVVVLPIQLEQLLIGQKLQSLGLGKIVERMTTAQSLAVELNKMLSDDTYTACVEKFLTETSGERISVASAVADYCQEVLGRSLNGPPEH